MVQAVLDSDPTKYANIKVNRIEVDNGEMIPTYTLFEKLWDEHRGCDFYFVIGADLVPTLLTWDFGPKFVKEVQFIIYQRKGYEYDPKDLPSMYCQVIHPEDKITDFSSSEVRALF